MHINEKAELHRAEAAEHLSVTGRRFFSMVEFDEQEELLCEIRKHPFGLFLVEVGGFTITAVMLAALFALGWAVNGNAAELKDTVWPIVIITAFVLGGLGVAGTIISSILYRSNVIFVTSDKIAQVKYQSLFHRTISQLSIGDVQDVTVFQRGIFPHIFNYGTLVIETAGEQQNYTFTFVPTPYENAKQIISAHEVNLKQYGN